MNMWRIKNILFFIGGLVAMSNTHATAYYGYDKSGDGTWHDVNKTFVGDCQLCWAAAASNILDWGGWGTATANTEASIFDEFKDHWTDQGSLAEYAWQWWFNGNVTSLGPGWATVDVPGGGNHWSDLNFNNFLSYSGAPDTLSTIATDLRQGLGTTIGIYGPGGHALTVWGYEYGVDAQDYQGIYITDSDDGETRLQYAPVSWDPVNSHWDMDTYGGGGWYIGNVQALDVRQLSILSGNWPSTTGPGSNDWTQAAYDDSSWINATAPYPDSSTTPGNIIPGTKAKLMWNGNSTDGRGDPNQAYFRLDFNLELDGATNPMIGFVNVIADDVMDMWVNGISVLDKLTLDGHQGSDNQPIPVRVDIKDYLTNGDNVIAIRANDGWANNIAERGFQYVFADGFIQTVPEPTSLILFGIGLAGLSFVSLGKSRVAA